MKVLNDYYCIGCGRTDEHYIESTLWTVPCKGCGLEATKVRAVPHFQLPGNDQAGFPTAYEKWEKKRSQKIKEELRAES